jgi:hypothetical protein
MLLPVLYASRDPHSTGPLSQYVAKRWLDAKAPASWSGPIIVPSMSDTNSSRGSAPRGKGRTTPFTSLKLPVTVTVTCVHQGESSKIPYHHVRILLIPDPTLIPNPTLLSNFGPLHGVAGSWQLVASSSLAYPRLAAGRARCVGGPPDHHGWCRTPTSLPHSAGPL